ncbi:type III-A CRISPR-associated RAMP protein Csm3 [Aureivirga sp. CE67]|uniref:type III-A CRISPR-associated RAMP protein Csm3 n=1 Tax=Aureivirga sp. CE67 TaxID=1788983 RepID=UPI0018CA7291|nr:type III-A CRISPR-associated RAMP protein Csm3 [Aureivirga sp. CE67]
MTKEETKMDKLIAKIIIKGNIEVVTGLHIGGSSATIEIGGVDNNIIKTANGIPYIPGSSLKGKLRNMLAKAKGSPNVETDRTLGGRTGNIFGNGANQVGKDERAEALLRVRDAYLNTKSINEDMKENMDMEFSEIKYENSIKRITGEANPRPLERVPQGARFEFEMVYDQYENEKSKNDLDEIAMAMKLLEMDYLGGAGSRGSGQIAFKEVIIEEHKINNESFKIEKSIIEDNPFVQFNISEPKTEPLNMN